MKTNTSTKTKIPRTTAAERGSWVQRFRQSGLTRQAFAAEQGVGVSTLSRWLTEAKGRPADPVPPMPWQEVALPATLSTPHWAAELCLLNGTTLRLTTELASDVLPRWLKDRSC